MELPSVVILPLGGKEGTEIVKGLLDVDELPEGKSTNGVRYWPWVIDNKYYTASVYLSIIDASLSHLSWMMENGEAFIVYCDSSKGECLENIGGILEEIDEFEPAVQMLVCDFCLDEGAAAFGLNRKDAQQWCINRGWELVELKEPEKSASDYEDDVEDDFQDSWGFKRMCQALHAHMWPNLSLKDSCSYSQTVHNLLSKGSSQCSSEVSGEHSCISEEADGVKVDCADFDTHGSILDDLVDSTTIEDCLNHPEGSTSFEELFSNFEKLKLTAASLPSAQRHDYAEKVAVAFWKALGGDDEEVQGTESDNET